MGIGREKGRATTNRRHERYAAIRRFQFGQGSPGPIFAAGLGAVVVVGDVHVSRGGPGPIFEIAPRTLVPEVPGATTIANRKRGWDYAGCSNGCG